MLRANRIRYPRMLLAVVICVTICWMAPEARPAPPVATAKAPPAGICSRYDPAGRVTWYEPDCPGVWPGRYWFYPSLARYDSGKRVLRLNACIRPARLIPVQALHLLIDGAEEALPVPPEQGGPANVDVDSDFQEHVTLGERGSLIRRLAGAREVQVVFDLETGRQSDSLPEESLAIFREMVSLHDSAELPNAAIYDRGQDRVHDPGAEGFPPRTMGEDQGSPAGDPEIVYEPNTPGMRLPSLIQSSKVQVKFPEEARSRLAAGKVILEIIVQSDGTVGNVEVLRTPDPDPGFVRAAVEAVKQWRYRPARKECRPVATHLTVIVEFKMPDPEDGE